jgi:hypothetical protein
MAGPVATVLINEPLSDPDRASLRTLIDAVNDPNLDRTPNSSSFWVCNTKPIGGGYTGDGRSFAIEDGLQPDWEPGQLLAVAEAFGFLPQDEVVVVAFCNSCEDHRILGELCLWLALRFRGVVNFGGALWPGVPPDAGIDIFDADWREVEPHFRRMIAGMPGQIVGLWYELNPGREWVRHVADADFLRVWLGNPRFRMVK